MEEQKNISNMGGTMRLGAYDCKLDADSKIAKAYDTTNISERHRHRYEFNNKYLEKLEKFGMKAVGFNEETKLVEVIEIPDHKW